MFIRNDNLIVISWYPIRYKTQRHLRQHPELSFIIYMFGCVAAWWSIEIFVVRIQYLRLNPLNQRHSPIMLLIYGESLLAPFLNFLRQHFILPANILQRSLRIAHGELPSYCFFWQFVMSSVFGVEFYGGLLQLPRRLILNHIEFLRSQRRLIRRVRVLRRVDRANFLFGAGRNLTIEQSALPLPIANEAVHFFCIGSLWLEIWHDHQRIFVFDEADLLGDLGGLFFGAVRFGGDGWLIINKRRVATARHAQAINLLLLTLPNLLCHMRHRLHRIDSRLARFSLSGLALLSLGSGKHNTLIILLALLWFWILSDASHVCNLNYNLCNPKLVIYFR